MVKLTTDEISIIAGTLASAGISGVGIHQLIVAMSSVTLQEYIGTMIVGSMLFNAGICGVTAFLSIWFNYQATL